ncbi:hypothetical protein GALMADRAFT_132424 [Galerina marginata CBS 339.88]|uniref:Uncharacterized protein n=1 Tax=Galerina marginata (strain CBS 339.88) TaxID=685588 RepID=A0A067TRB0_GALM3|nr:hypothetical protein GALMADRAFT_132424 [Galerina marginata CBS 339.88]
MLTPTSPTTDVPSSPEGTDTVTTTVSELSTPLTRSGRTSPTCVEVEETPEVSTTATHKKKKKKKSKKSAKAKDASAASAKDDADMEGRPPVLCISRNKHWRYISSYHGPWLQLPVELLDSLLTLNLDPGTLTGPEARLPPLLSPTSSVSSSKQRDRSLHGFGDFSPPDSPRNTYASMPLPPPFPPPKPGKATPPPIDPGVFRSVRNIRRLIDEAAELSVRASSGLSAAELGSMRSGSAFSGSPWATAQSLGLNPLGNNSGGGRNVAMSAMRIHRLRALSVQKLAQAYKADEIASSVMVMQGGSVFDDVAERVLKVDPNDADAKYVHFFHEKIPSRQLAESTTTNVLDELIAAYPQRLEYYRTRGIVHCFRDEFTQATKDFTYALKEARAVRKAKMAHHDNGSQSESRTNKHGKRRKGKSANHTNGQAPPDGTSAMDGVDGSDGEPLLKHPSVLEDAPEPIEPQLLFLRGAAHLQQSIHLIEAAVLKLEGIRKTPSVDGAELRLCYIENGKYGGVEIGNPDGPLGKRDGAKLQAYAKVLGEKTFRDLITRLLEKSLRDHEKFLSHFDSLESPNAIPDGDIAFQTEYAFLLSESIRPGNHGGQPPPISDAPAVFTTYHPLLVESHFSVLICELMLADFTNILPMFIRTASIVDGLEGYPIFLPPRSMAQAEFVEVLERLAGGWRNGIYPHSLSAQRGKHRLTIEGPLVTQPSRSSVVQRSDSYEDEQQAGGSSSSSSTRQNSMCSTGTFSASSSSTQPLSSIGTSSASGSASDVNQANGHTKQEEPAPPPSPFSTRPDAAIALDCARILLAPVAKRQRERAEKAAAEKAATGGKKKPVPINIPLHGPRVEVILAWLGGVHLPELDEA